MTITADMAKDLRGSEVFDTHDEKLGKVGEVYVDNSSGEPKWVTVNTGMLGTKETFVPLAGAKSGNHGLSVATDKKTVKGAPNTGEAEGQLSEREERRLYSHYGLEHGGSDHDATGQNGRTGHATDDRRSNSGHDSSDKNRDMGREQGKQHAQDGMTRSEERLAVGTESVETGTVRLRKYVVTENQQVEVPVSHEEVRIEREAVSGNRPAQGSLGDDEHAVTLHAERPVVSKEAHEVERVRLDTKTVTENHTISDDVRKEQIDVDDPNNTTGHEHGDRQAKGDRNENRSGNR